MYRLVAISVLSVLLGCQAQYQSDEYLVGKWKSNEKLTLESMNRVEGVTLEARELFENDFFGNAVVEYKEDVFRITDKKLDYVSDFEPYEILEATSTKIRLKSWNSVFEEYQEWDLFLNGDCYYIIVSKFEFREYYCRYG